MLFQGVLYHLQHPLLGLQRVCEMTKDVALIGSHVVEHLMQSKFPIMRFYPVNELGGQYDNWWGPSTQCLIDMTKAAGFARVELLYTDTTATLLKAYRSWEYPPLLNSPSLFIREVRNAVRLDQRLERRGRFALLAIWVEGLPLAVTRNEVRVEIGGFGIMPAYVEAPLPHIAEQAAVGLNRLTPARLDIDPALAKAATSFVQVVTPIPPGLKPGETTLRIYYDNQWLEDFAIHLSDNRYW